MEKAAFKTNSGRAVRLVEQDATRTSCGKSNVGGRSGGSESKAAYKWSGGLFFAEGHRHCMKRTAAPNSQALALGFATTETFRRLLLAASDGPRESRNASSCCDRAGRARVWGRSGKSNWHFGLVGHFGLGGYAG